MAKRNNSRKRKIEIKKIKPKKIVTKRILTPLAIFIVLAGAILFLRNSAYFNLKTVTIIDSANAVPLTPADILRTYKGRNIFGIDVQAQAKGLKKDYPVAENVIVKRVMPDSIEIRVIPRIPVAKLKTREYFPIDNSGMVLSPKTEGVGNLPVIVGFSPWTRLSVGEYFKNAQLESAFSLLSALKESSVMGGYGVTVIDVSNHKNLYFYLENGIEVRIGEGDFAGRLTKLKTTLGNNDLDKDNIKYLDLRFDGVVIGPK